MKSVKISPFLSRMFSLTVHLIQTAIMLKGIFPNSIIHKLIFTKSIPLLHKKVEELDQIIVTTGIKKITLTTLV